MGGFVLIHRSLIGNPKFRDKDDEYAAIWLITKAEWRSTCRRISGRSIHLDRGQCCCAVSYLAKAWDCSKSSAHTRLRRFEKNGFVRTELRTGLTVITICNYDDYQLESVAPRTGVRTKPERCPNDARTNLNESNESNEGRYISDSPTPPPSGHPPSATSDQGDFLNPDTAIDPEAKGDTVSPFIDEAQSPVEVAIRMWNAMANRAGRPRVQKTTRKRRAMLLRRLKDAGGLDGWELALEKVAASPFLTGKSNSDWKGATLDWVINEDNFTKIMEGNYDLGPKRFPGDKGPGGVMAALDRLERTP